MIDEPDEGIPDLWSGTEMAEMLGTVAHLTKLCANASKAILDGAPETLAGTLGTIIGRAEALREHVWEYTKQ